jgi:hypothetical protein
LKKTSLKRQITTDDTQNLSAAKNTNARLAHEAYDYIDNAPIPPELKYKLHSFITKAQEVNSDDLLGGKYKHGGMELVYNHVQGKVRDHLVAAAAAAHIKNRGLEAKAGPDAPGPGTRGSLAFFNDKSGKASLGCRFPEDRSLKK